jgi:hypothetical protein
MQCQNTCQTTCASIYITWISRLGNCKVLWHEFVTFALMYDGNRPPYRGIPPLYTISSPANTVSRNKASELIRSYWRPEAITKKVHFHPSTLYKWENRIQMYGAIDRLAHLRLPTGRPRRLHSAAVDSLLEYQKQNPWVYQDEMAIFLEEEWGI